MTRQHLFPSRSRQGSILVVSLVLMVLAAVSTVLMSRTLMDHQRLNNRRRELWRAFYLAEGGIAQIQQWALYPDQYSISPTLFKAANVSPPPTNTTTGLVDEVIKFQDRYPALYAAIHSGDGLEISRSSLQAMGVGEFSSRHGYQVGRVESLRLSPPAAGDPIACDFKIDSVGRSQDGIERSVLGYARVNPVLEIRIPAALISFEGVAVNGNAKIHWGEAWSRNNMKMESQNQYAYLATDPKAIWRTTGLINEWGGGWRVNTFIDPDVFTGFKDMGVKAPYFGRFLQAQSIASFPAAWPQFDYQTFKEMAQSHGRYYSTDAAGNVYRDGIEDASHRVDFLTEFGVANRDTAPYDLVFIDTINEQPPAADGSNLAHISVSGNSLGLKGVFYVGASLDASGVGSPPQVKAVRNGTTVLLSNIFLHGVMYTAGTLGLSGNAGVYGSVVTQKGFSGGGTPDVYYNAELAKGIPLGDGNVGSPFKVTLYTNY